VITDFADGDSILLDGIAGIEDPADVTPLMSQDGSDVLITFDVDNTIRLVGVDLGDLQVVPAALIEFA
jgi:hypothetical protein